MQMTAQLSRSNRERVDTVDSVLRLEGHVSFGREDPAFVQQSHAIEAVMYGDKDQAIPRNNSLKALLLGQSSTIIHLHKKLETASPEAAAYLKRVSNGLNVQQYQAVKSALFTKVNVDHQQDVAKAYGCFVSFVLHVTTHAKE